ncbi:MAG: hypothetical protein HY303_07825 [Candidatus Wallbacteria bacterium]|nr:hypothetical protein [Candidatus Wallbacteria bacterium]
MTHCVIVFLLLAAGRAAADPSEAALAVPLRVHLLRSRAAGAAGTVLTTADVERVVEKAGRIWAQAGLSLTVDRVVEERATGPLAESTGTLGSESLSSLVPSASFDPRAFNVYFIRRMQANGILVPHQGLPAIFVKDTAQLRQVPAGADEPIPRVLSHELGHALGLAHQEEVQNLMASGTSGTSLNALEKQAARKNASTVPWIRRVAAGQR